MSDFTHSNRAKSKQFLQDIGALLDADFNISEFAKPLIDLIGAEGVSLIVSLIPGAGIAAGTGVYAVLKAAEKPLKKAVEQEISEQSKQIKQEFENRFSGDWNSMNFKDRLYTRLRIIRVLDEGVRTDKVNGVPVMHLLGQNKLDKKKEQRLIARLMFLNQFWCTKRGIPELPEIDPDVVIRQLVGELDRQGHKERGATPIVNDQETFKNWTSALAFYKESASGISIEKTGKALATAGGLAAVLGFFK